MEYITIPQTAANDLNGFFASVFFYSKIAENCTREEPIKVNMPEGNPWGSRGSQSTEVQEPGNVPQIPRRQRRALLMCRNRWKSLLTSKKGG